MRNETSIRQWQVNFLNEMFANVDCRTQIQAGWFDWFCKDSSLRAKTYRMGNIIKQIKDGGKVDLDNWYVWFKNNCPLNGPLYDDFRFADKQTGSVMFTVQTNRCWNKHRYTVYGRRTPNGDFECETPLFESDDSRSLVKWFNTPWEK